MCQHSIHPSATALWMSLERWNRSHRDWISQVHPCRPGLRARLPRHRSMGLCEGCDTRLQPPRKAQGQPLRRSLQWPASRRVLEDPPVPDACGRGRTAQSATRSRSRRPITMAQPAHHRENGRKTPDSGGQAFDLGSSTRRLLSKPEGTSDSDQKCSIAPQIYPKVKTLDLSSQPSSRNLRHVVANIRRRVDCAFETRSAQVLLMPGLAGQTDNPDAKFFRGVSWSISTGLRANFARISDVPSPPSLNPSAGKSST